MPCQPDARSYGSVFDEVAEDYDRHRPTYPDVLVDRACEDAGIGPGDAVLEDRLRHGEAHPQPAGPRAAGDQPWSRASS